MKKHLWQIVWGALYAGLAVLVGVGACDSRRSAVQELPPHVGTFGASGSRPTNPNPYWAQASWFFDPANTSTCASDKNNCSQSSCGAANSNQGPCLTYGQILTRWEGQPTLLQDTTIAQMSVQAGQTDWIIFDPRIGNGARVIFKGNSLGTAIGSGTLNAVTAKSVLSAAGNDLQSTFTSTAPTAAGQLVVNTTKGSQAWVTRLVSGANWGLSQPLASASPPLSNRCGFLAEDNTWATGNSVTVYASGSGGIGATIAEIAPTYIGVAASAFNQLTVYRIVFSDPSGNHAPTRIGSNVQLLEDTVPNTNGSTLQMNSNASAPMGGLINTATDGPYASINVTASNGSITAATNAVCVYGGGTFGATGVSTQTVFNATAYGLNFGADYEVAGNIADVYFYGSTFIDSIQDWGGADFWFAGATYFAATGAMSQYNEGPQVWGQRNPLLIGPGIKLMYHGSGGTLDSADVFLSGNPQLTFNKSPGGVGSTACSLCTSTLTCGITISPTNMDAACSATGFGGRVILQGNGEVIDTATFPTQ